MNNESRWVVQPGQFGSSRINDSRSGEVSHDGGWGWGRWIGMDLKPDGQTLDFRKYTLCRTVIMRFERNDYVSNADKEQQTRCAVKPSRCLPRLYS